MNRLNVDFAGLTSFITQGVVDSPYFSKIQNDRELRQRFEHIMADYMAKCMEVFASVDFESDIEACFRAVEYMAAPYFQAMQALFADAAEKLKAAPEPDEKKSEEPVRIKSQAARWLRLRFESPRLALDDEAIKSLFDSSELPEQVSTGTEWRKIQRWTRSYAGKQDYTCAYLYGRLTLIQLSNSSALEKNPDKPNEITTAYYNNMYQCALALEHYVTRSKPNKETRLKILNQAKSHYESVVSEAGGVNTSAGKKLPELAIAGLARIQKSVQQLEKPGKSLRGFFSAQKDQEKSKQPEASSGNKAEEEFVEISLSSSSLEVVEHQRDQGKPEQTEEKTSVAVLAEAQPDPDEMYKDLKSDLQDFIDEDNEIEAWLEGKDEDLDVDEIASALEQRQIKRNPASNSDGPPPLLLTSEDPNWEASRASARDCKEKENFASAYCFYQLTVKRIRRNFDINATNPDEVTKAYYRCLMHSGEMLSRQASPIKNESAKLTFLKQIEVHYKEVKEQAKNVTIADSSTDLLSTQAGKLLDDIEGEIKRISNKLGIELSQSASSQFSI